MKLIVLAFVFNFILNCWPKTNINLSSSDSESLEKRIPWRICLIICQALVVVMSEEIMTFIQKEELVQGYPFRLRLSVCPRAYCMSFHQSWRLRENVDSDICF